MAESEALFKGTVQRDFFIIRIRPLTNGLKYFRFLPGEIDSPGFQTPESHVFADFFYFQGVRFFKIKILNFSAFFIIIIENILTCCMSVAHVGSIEKRSKTLRKL